MTNAQANAKAVAITTNPESVHVKFEDGSGITFRYRKDRGVWQIVTRGAGEHTGIVQPMNVPTESVRHLVGVYTVQVLDHR